MHRASWLQESKYYIAQIVRPNYRDVLRVVSLARDDYHVRSADMRLQLATCRSSTISTKTTIPKFKY